jgi:hypothetical protein
VNLSFETGGTNEWKLPKVILRAFFLGLCCEAVLAQTAPQAVLELDINYLYYENDQPDYSKLATDPGSVRGVPGKNLIDFVFVGDIVAVNGKPAKGTFVSRAKMLALNPNPVPGQAIADINRANIQHSAFEIMTADGRAVGTIFANGMGGGVAPPGAPLVTTAGDQTIVGGTGAFFGRADWLAAVQLRKSPPQSSR